jgi:hypothetical protein
VHLQRQEPNFPAAVIPKNRISPADLTLILNPYILNADTFDEPVPGLKPVVLLRVVRD